jgi:predicted glycosyltransferase
MYAKEGTALNSPKHEKKFADEFIAHLQTIARVQEKQQAQLSAIRERLFGATPIANKPDGNVSDKPFGIRQHMEMLLRHIEKTQEEIQSDIDSIDNF